MGNELLNYMNPPIPKGFHYVEGKWNTGFVIARDLDQSEFIWIPVGYLEANGTSNGIIYNERFGGKEKTLTPFPY